MVEPKGRTYFMKSTLFSLQEIRPTSERLLIYGDDGVWLSDRGSSEYVRNLRGSKENGGPKTGMSKTGIGPSG